LGREALSRRARFESDEIHVGETHRETPR